MEGNGRERPGKESMRLIEGKLQKLLERFGKKLPAK